MGVRKHKEVIGGISPHRLFKVCNFFLLREVQVFNWLLDSNCPRPAIVADSEGLTILYRTTVMGWLQELSIPFNQACASLLSSALSDQAVLTENKNNTRGPHFPCILGHYRQYASVSLKPSP